MRLDPDLFDSAPGGAAFALEEETEEEKRKREIELRDRANQQKPAPDQFAADAKVAARENVPVEAVTESSDLFADDGLLGEERTARLAKESPVTARALATEKSLLLRDDTENLGWFEKTARYLGRRWTTGNDQIEMALLGQKAMRQELSDEESFRLAYLEMLAADGADRDRELFGFQTPDFGFGAGAVQATSDFISSVPGEATQMLPLMLHTMAESWDAALVGAGLGAAAGLAGGPLAPVTIPAGATVGLTAGLTGGVARETAKVEMGLAYNEFIKLTDSGGVPIGADAARGAAFAVGLTNGILETVAFNKLAKMIPGVGRLQQLMTRGGLKPLIASNPTIRNAFARFGKNVITTGFSEGVIEGMQELTNLLAQELALDQDLTAEQYVERIGEAARAGAAGGGGLAVAGGGVTATAEVGQIAATRVAKARENAKAVEALVERAKQSRVLQRLPSAFQDHVRELQEEYGEVEVSVEAEALATFFQSTEEDAASLRADMPVTMENMEEVAETGGEVVIPLEELLTVAAKHEVAGLIPDARLGQELTQREADTLSEQMAEVTQEEQGPVSAADQIETSQAQVYENVLQQLTEAGQAAEVAGPMATLMSEVIATQAQRADIDPLELYESFGIEVRQADLAELQQEEAAVEAAEVAQQQVLGTKAELDELKAQSFEAREAAQDVTGEEQQTLFDRHEALRAEVEAADGRYLEAIKARDAAAEVGIRPAVTRMLEQSVALREGTEALDIKTAPTKSGRPSKPSTRQVAGALERRTRKRHGTIKRNSRTPGTRKKIAGWIVDEALYELERPDNSNSGVGWYSTKFQAALDSFGSMFPELAGTLDESLPGVVALGSAQAARDFLTALIALTSDGQRVYSNFRLAARIYADFRETGRLDPELGRSGGERALSITQNIATLQEMLDEHGPEAMHPWLLEENTVSELNARAREQGIEFSSGYPATETLPRAAIIFGPKLGAFYANLMGQEGYLTMDRWWTRTINRYRGQLLTKVSGTEKAPTDARGNKIGLARYKEMIGRPEISDDEAMVDVAEDQANYKAKGFKNGTDAEKAANTIYKAAYDGIEDQPFNTSDRKLMIEAVREARDTLAERGHDVTVADVQAILWYYEKRLYGELGARQTADVSYADVAERIIDEGPGGLHRPGGRVDQEPGGDVAQGPDGAGFSLAQQGGKGPPRGFIEFGPGRDFFRVTLTERANLSTFLHESGHFYLELLGRMAEIGTDQQRADFQAIRDWLGAAPGEAFTTEQHEQFARGFESYLMEGKAPSSALRDAFSRFKAWLVMIYKTFDKLDVELTDDVRQVMDRLVATDAAIAVETQALDLVPIQELIDELGDEQGREYAESYANAIRMAQQNIDREAIEEWKRRRTAEYREAKERYTDLVTEDVNSRGEVAARYFMLRGIMLDGSEAPEDLGKISSDVVKGYGPEYAKRDRGMTKKGGAHPDAVAAHFGFDSGQEMLDAISRTDPRADIIKREVQAQLDAEFGDITQEAGEAGIEALHNDATAAYLDLELRILNRERPVGGRRAPLKILRQAARDRIRAMEVRHLKPGRYLQAEKRAARQATKALVEGDREQAAMHKRQQLMSHFMYREALAARDKSAKIRKDLSRYTKTATRARIGKAGESYLEAIDTLLEGVELKAVTEGELVRRADLAAFVVEQEALGNSIEIPDHLIDASQLTNWRQMNIDELTALHDAVKSIAHVAGRKNELVSRRQKADLNAVAEAVDKRARQVVKGRKTGDHQNPQARERARNLIHWGRAGLTKPEFLLKWLDGEVAGLANQWIFEPLVQAQIAASDMLQDLKRAVFDPLDKLPADQRSRWNSDVVFLGTKMKGHEVIAVALNVGNAGNLQKLVDGYSERGWTEETVLAELDRWMTKADWDMVQHIWDQIGSLREPLFDVTQRVTGLRPPAVEALPVETRHGTYKGGYFPVVYDPRRSHKALQHEDKKALGLFENNYFKPAVTSGATKARVAYSAPILLSLDVIGRHLIEQVHFITHVEAVMNAEKLISHPKFRATVTELLGPEYYQQLRPWLQAVANDGVPSTERTLVEGLLGHIRSGVSVVAMGLNPGTALKQFFGLVTAFDAIKPRFLAAGLVEALSVSGRKFGNEQSGELRHLATQMDRDIRKVATETFGKGQLGQVNWGKWQNRSFLPLIYAQKVVNQVVWHAAYKQALHEGRTEGQAKSYAASQVRLTQSGGGVKDLAEIQRGPATRQIFVMFYTYFSVLYNRIEDVGRTAGIRRPDIVAARLTVLVLLPVLFEELIRNALSDDDEEGRAGFATLALLYGMTTVPFVRDVASGVMGDYGYQLSPVGQMTGRMVRATQAVYEAAVDDEEMSESEFSALVDTVGIATKLPTRAVYRMLDAIIDVTE